MAQISPSNMTSNVLPLYFVASGSDVYVGHDYYQAFDGNAGTDWRPNVHTYGDIAIDLATAQVAASYSVQGSAYPTASPKTWDFQGKVNAGDGWTTLDHQADQESWGSGETRTFSFSTITAYRYYQLHITANNGDANFVLISELKIFGASNISITADPLNATTSLSASLSIYGSAEITADPLNATTSLQASVHIQAGPPVSITADPFDASLSLVAYRVGGQNRLSQNLPALLGSGTLVSRSGRVNAILPILTISADGKVGEVGSMAAVLPGLQMVGTGLSGALGTMGVTLPVLSIVATGQPQRSAVANITLPFFYINAHGETKQATAPFKVLAMNLKNFAVTEYENFDFNSFAEFNGIFLGAKEDGIYPLVGSDDQGTDIDAKITTGKAFIEHWRLRDLFSYGLSGGQKRSKMARGIHSGYTDFTLENSDGDEFDLDYFEVLGDPLRRKRH